jgi:hypothetical protein
MHGGGSSAKVSLANEDSVMYDPALTCSKEKPLYYYWQMRL